MLGSNFAIFPKTYPGGDGFIWWNCTYVRTRSGIRHNLRDINRPQHTIAFRRKRQQKRRCSRHRISFQIFLLLSSRELAVRWVVEYTSTSTKYNIHKIFNGNYFKC